MKKYLRLIIIFAWMILIFFLSGAEAKESNDLSESITYKIVSAEYKINGEEINKNEVNHIIRKVAHFTLYFVLALLIWNFLHFYYKKYYERDNYILTIVLCFFYSLTDEFHQLFVNGRTGQFSDCLIDTCGSALAILLVCLVSSKKKFLAKK